MSEDRNVLVCVECGETCDHNTYRETCPCGGRLHHWPAWRIGAWKLLTGQTHVVVTGFIDKVTLYRRCLGQFAVGGGVS